MARERNRDTTRKWKRKERKTHPLTVRIDEGKRKEKEGEKERHGEETETIRAIQNARREGYSLPFRARTGRYVCYGRRKEGAEGRKEEGKRRGKGKYKKRESLLEGIQDGLHASSQTPHWMICV